jgi:GT2 family glycosyltransferase
MDKMLAVVPVHNRREITLRCLGQLLSQRLDDASLDIMVIDDGSTDGTSEEIKKRYPSVELAKGDGNLWWAGGVNRGLQHALEGEYEFAYLVNDDNDLEPDTLNALYRHAAKLPNVICTSLVIDAQDHRTVLNAGFTYKGLLRKISPNGRGRPSSEFVESIRVDLIGSRSTLVPRSCIEKTGLFDRTKFPQHFSDLEYFARAREHGFILLVVNQSKVYTKENPDYYFSFVSNKNAREIISGYNAVKNMFYWKNIVYRSYIDRGIIRGSILLAREILLHCFLIISKLVMPDKIFIKLIKLRR